MKKIFLFGILYSFIFNVFGQDFTYDWEKDRALYKLSSAEKDIPLYVLDQKNIYNYFLEDNGLKVSYTFHKIVRVTNDDALQKSTRIVVPLGDDGELKQLKARTLEPSGKEILFDETELKELEDEQSGSGYKIFAIEGAIKGSEIEFFYTVEKGADLFLRQFMQFDFPVKSSEFHLSCPEHLKFDVKAYNNLAEVNIEEGKEERNEYTIKQNDISALLEEQFSSYDNSRMRVEAKLSYNTARNNSRMFTWSDAAKRIYENLYTLDKNELKTVSSLIKKIKVSDSDNEITKILKIEDYLKRTIYFENRAPSELLVQTVRNRYANKPTMTKLYLAVLKEFGIESQLILTSDVTEIKMDSDFDTWNYLTEYLIYFPGIDKYLAPYYYSLRTGTIPPYAQTNNALRVKTVALNGVEYPISDVIIIPEHPSTSNQSNLDISAKLNESLTELVVDMKHELIGFEAFSIKSVYPELEEERRKELLDNLAHYISQDIEVKDTKINEITQKPENWSDPLVIQTTYISNTFLEKAGSSIIVKIGELIGPQSELYQEKERQTDVMNSFNRRYDRHIVLEIPNGYSVKNPDDIKMNVNVEEDGEKIYYFVSDYKIEGNKLVIDITEAYERIYYPKENFQEFREVINAAADWNKVKLVLQKK